MIGLKLRRKTLARISQVLSLIGESLLEGLINVGLNVVLVESALTLLVLLQVAAHVLVKALLLLVQVRLHRLVVTFALIVLHLDLGELITQSPQTFDLRSQFLFLIFHFDINPLNQCGKLLQRLALDIVQLLLQLRNSLNLVLNLTVALDTLLLLQIPQEVINITSTLLQDLLGPIEHSHLSLDLIQSLLHSLKLVVLDSETGRILSKVIFLHILLAFFSRVLLLFLSKLLLVGDLFHFEFLDLLLFLIFFLAHSVGLGFIHGEVIISRRILLQFNI